MSMIHSAPKITFASSSPSLAFSAAGDSDVRRLLSLTIGPGLIERQLEVVYGISWMSRDVAATQVHVDSADITAVFFITDYFPVRKGNFWHADLFTPSKDSAYYYHFGLNWRCVVAFLVTVVTLMPGFAAQFGHEVGLG
ncbi:hypothetical protein BU23DRAFT_574356 [Bimuria novae-zelandiae CBS 107.79]|uniref:Uncharacterized protein n=1 Tax=Bimuria novae-zelandiae CBS 107.79 TaxID=1447943 RepID=A0A6A5UNZ7_9PLEO|nr:hypothetical protein BU23DRAFT_574356 [Bimuria novae-zelandiae CBS 107.79]